MKIVSIKKKDGLHKVYCVNVPIDNEILLSNGVIVGNCLFGASGFGLARTLGLEKDEGDIILKSFKCEYSDVDKFMEGQKEFAKKNGYVKNLLGRKRRLPELTYIGQDSWKNYQSSFKLSNLINNTFNSPIQGTSGQVTFAAMTNIWRELKQKDMKSKLLINVHDELVMMIWIPEKDKVKEIVERWMTYPYYEAKDGNMVKLQAELEIGEVWKDCKSYKYWEEHPEEYNNMINTINRRNKENQEYIKQKNILI